MFLFSIPKPDLVKMAAGEHISIRINGQPATVWYAANIDGQPAIHWAYNDSEAIETRIVCDISEANNLATFHCMEIGSELTIIRPQLDGTIETVKY